MCFGKGVLLYKSVDCSSSCNQQPPAAAVKIGFLLGFQKARSGSRGACYCDWFCVLFGTKLGGVLPFRVCFEKGVWLLVSCFRGWLIAAAAATSSSRPAAAPAAASCHQQLPPAAAVKIRFLLGFQKGRSSPRGACYCDWFCVLFGTKLGGVLPFRVCFEKGVWLLVSCFRSWLIAAAAAATSSSTTSSMSKFDLISSRTSEGTFLPPGSLLLRLILRPFRHEFCRFGCVSKKVSGCLFLALKTVVDGSSSSSHQQQHQ